MVGLFLLAAFSPVLALIASNFRSPEYFSLMVLGLLAASMLSSGSPLRSIATVIFGLVLGIVGLDVNSGAQRFTFGILGLYDGLPLVAIALGLFGLPEVIANAGRLKATEVPTRKIRFRDMVPTREDWRLSWKPMLRGSGIGSFFGALPGTGGLIASFMSYAVEKRINKDPSKFGKGAIEGVTGPEAANNAAIQTAFIPTLTLGIPGDVLMALMLGVLMIHGVSPGPELVTQNPEMFWGLVISFFFGNVMLLVLNIPLIGLWVRLLSIPYSILFPAIVGFICIGVYSVKFEVLDLFVVAVFGLIGYGMAVLKFHPAPLVLGLILGPMMEVNLRRSLLLSRGDPMTFVDRPFSAAFMLASVLLIAWIVYREMSGRRARRKSAG